MDYYNNPYILILHLEIAMKTKLKSQERKLERKLKTRRIKAKIPDKKELIRIPKGGESSIWFTKLLDECGINGPGRRTERRACFEIYDLLFRAGIIEKSVYSSNDLNEVVKFIGAAYDCENPFKALHKLRKTLQTEILPRFIPEFETLREMEYWKQISIRDEVLRTLKDVYSFSRDVYTLRKTIGLTPELPSMMPILEEVLPERIEKDRTYFFPEFENTNYELREEREERKRGLWENGIRGLEDIS